MIQACKLGHIVLKVRDAGASRDFYTRTLGLKVAHEDLEQGMVFLSFGQEHHELALFQLATGEAPRATQPGLHHMAWKLQSFEELQAAHRELKAMGVPVEATIGSGWSPSATSAPDTPGGWPSSGTRSSRPAGGLRRWSPCPGWPGSRWPAAPESRSRRPRRRGPPLRLR